MPFLPKCLKVTLAVFTFFLIGTTCQAKVLPGYIITQESDTIWGSIKVYTFNRYTGAWVFNGIDLEWCYLEATFKEKGEFWFKTYSPERIKEYGFTYKDQAYIFHSKNISTKSIYKRTRELKQFLNVIYSENGIIVYRHQKYAEGHHLYKFHTGETTFVPCYEFYISDGSCTLRKLKENHIFKHITL
ncbi:hypothetical protein E9993_16575 [Labilibacter sediminis]|nr:hypothetical protein E9993_16575 [Labilibacter sediminis]